MQLSKILIDDPPPPPFLLLQDLQDSHDILNYKFKRFEFEDDFFQWMINIILHFKFQVPFRWKKCAYA